MYVCMYVQRDCDAQCLKIWAMFHEVWELQGLYRPWKVLEFYCSEFQALESPGKRHRSWKILEL